MLPQKSADRRNENMLLLSVKKILFMDVLGDLSVHTCGFSRQVAFELRLNMSEKTIGTSK